MNKAALSALRGSLSLRVPLLLGVAASLTSTSLAQAPIRAFEGAQAGELFGRTVADAGDLDGDGASDLLIGAPFGGARGGGRVVAISGATGAQLFEWTGESAGDLFGAALGGGLDVSGDGIPDVVVGARGADVLDFGGGSVTVFSGADGSELMQLHGPGRGDGLGAAVGLLSDVNGDGRAEVLVSAWGDDTSGTNSGVVQVRDVVGGQTLFEVSGSSYEVFGTALAATGDLDGDGVGDFAVAGRWSSEVVPGAGAVHAFSGATGSSLWTAGGEVAGDSFGASLAGGLDLTRDGTPDLVVGAPGHDAAGASSGRAYLLSGTDGSVLLSLDGDAAGDALGSAVSLLDDADADGTRELALGAPGAGARGASSGVVRLHRPDGTLLASLGPDSDGDQVGVALARLADVDGDNLEDLAVGARADDHSGAFAGHAKVFSISTPAPVFHCETSPNTTGDGAVISFSGSVCAAAGDFVLEVDGATAGQFGIFYHGQNAIQVAFGSGWRCAGGGIQRLAVLSVDAFGHAADEPIWELLGSGRGGLAVGETRNFQFWYRDPSDGAAGFNLSDALGATFAP